MNYSKWFDVIEKHAKTSGYEHYEIVEDSYDGFPAILLIIYEDKNHEVEKEHFVFSEEDCRDIERQLKIEEYVKFDHISKVWDFLDMFKTVEELEEAFNEIPSKFGGFDIINRSTCEKEGMIEICNSYWDESVGDYDYDYHTIEIGKEVK